MTPLTAREQIGNDLGWVSLSQKNELDTLLNRIWKHYMQWREKRLEQEVAYHSHFGTEMHLWVHYTSLWCEVCLSLVVPRKEPIHWAILPFFICSSILTEVGCVRGKSQHFAVKNLKKKFGSKIVEIAMTFETPPFTTCSKKIGLLRLTSSLQEHKLPQLSCKLYVLKSHHYFGGYWKGR